MITQFRNDCWHMEETLGHSEVNASESVRGPSESHRLMEELCSALEKLFDVTYI